MTGEQPGEAQRTPVVLPDTLVEAFDQGVAAAPHLDDDRYAPALAAARKLAAKIDAWDRIVQWANDDADEHGGRPAVPQNDNVSISAFNKAMDSLGLTPAGAKALELSRYGRTVSATKEGDPTSGSDDSTQAEAATGRVASIHERRARSGRPA